MEGLISLESLYASRQFSIPEYQRSYSWERRQWEDLVEDLDVLPEGKDHFTGMIVLLQRDGPAVVDRGEHSITKSMSSTASNASQPSSCSSTRSVVPPV